MSWTSSTILRLMRLAIVFFIHTGLAGAADPLVFPRTADEINEAMQWRGGSIEHEQMRSTTRRGLGGVKSETPPLLRPQTTRPRAGAIVKFDFDSAEIHPGSYGVLDEWGKALTGGLADATIQIEGHTDSRGSREYNQRLSERRAEAVERYLTRRHHISPDRLAVLGYGEERPIRSNQTAEGRAYNRRVEFVRMR